MEAISHAGIVIGVLSKDGVVLAAEKKVTGKLLDMSGATGGSYGGSGEKIFLLNSCVLLSVLDHLTVCSTTHRPVIAQKCHLRSGGNHGRRELARELRTTSGTEAPVQLQ